MSRWCHRQAVAGFAVRASQVRYFLLLLLLSFAIPSRVQATPPTDSPQRLVAIGDVHGDFNDLCAILQRAGLIDEQRRWTGGTSIFVQVGDLIDRGPNSRAVLDLMISLEDQATRAGGRVVSLLGNHEVMNLMGDLRYATAESYAGFADSESEKRRTTAFGQYTAWRTNHPQLLAEVYQPVLPVTEAEWMTKHPLGFIEQREALSPGGTYGKWLRQRPALTKIRGLIFLHGGLNPDLTSLKLDDMNEQIRGEIHQFDELRKYLTDEHVLLPFFTLQEAAAAAQAELIAERKLHVVANDMRQSKILRFLEFGNWLCVREDGPLWFRGYDRWTEEEGLPQVEKILRAYGASNIIVGHTVQRTARIRSRFGGKVMLIDTGMLSSYYPGGKASALQISNDSKFTAIYLDQQPVLIEGNSGRSATKEQ